MPKYVARFRDAQGAEGDVEFFASSDAAAAAIGAELAGKSSASWIALLLLEDLAVDSAVFTEYQAPGKPAAGSTVRAQGELRYGVATPDHEVLVTIPAVSPAVLSPFVKRIATDPAGGVGRLQDAEGADVQSFGRGRYLWGRRKR